MVKTLRLALLLTLLAAAAVLYVLNQNFDPRFYRFLESDSGRAVAQIVGWSADFELPPTDVPESEMTPRELAVKQQLEAAVWENLPTHRVILRSGEILLGQVARYGPTHVEFEETYGQSGRLSAWIRRSRIRDVLHERPDPPSITYRDVRFQMEFPEFSLERRPPYTILTDENYFRVQDSVRTLHRLHDEFMETFGGLIARPERGKGIQLLFFGNARQYRDYADRHAPLLEHTSGFYSPQLDRLTVFNQVTSGQLNKARRTLREQADLYREQANTRQDLDRIQIWENDSHRNIEYVAELETRRTLRHEGAHQLFFTYGVHSSHHAENTWLIEGLALYCESEVFGAITPEQSALLKRHLEEGPWIPLAAIVESRSPRGFYVFGRSERVQLAYTASWAIVHYLMQPHRRQRFFDYIRYVRDPERLDTLAQHDRMDILAAFLGMSPASLEEDWTDYVRCL